MTSKISTSYVRKQLRLILKRCSSLISLLALAFSYSFRQFQPSALFSRPAGQAGMALSGPCSGSWCWSQPRVSGVGEGAAGSCGGSEGRTVHTGQT